MPHPRKIIHVDMDAFYASVEQRDNPAYGGRPLAVGGPPESRGVVAAASYEARAFGVRSAMPSARARERCPQLIFVKPRFEVYRAVSAQIRAVFAEYTELVEPLSLDEAYLDVSDCRSRHNSASLIAADIRRAIRERTGLTASAGVSYNKFLAKLASDVNKPDGQYLITPQQGPAFVAGLPIGRFHGIGEATEAKMRRLGIRNGAELRGRSLEELQRRFGKLGRHYYAIARGVDERPVQPRRARKSISTETTFERDLNSFAAAAAELYKLAAELSADLAAKRLRAQTVTIKVRYADFRLVTRSQTLSRPFRDLAPLRSLLATLLKRTDAGLRPVRLLGVGVSNFTEPHDGDTQLPLL